MSVDTRLIEIAENMKKVYTAGFKDGNLKAEMNPLKFTTKLSFVWSKVAFPKDFNMLLEIETNANLSSAFIQTSGIKTAKIIVKKPYIGNLQALFRESVDLELVDFSEFNLYPETISHLFYSNDKLKTVLGELDLSYCTIASSAFTGTYSLETISFKPGTIKVDIDFSYSKSLTKESLLSILNGLYNYNLNLSLLNFRPDFFADGDTVSGIYKITEVEVTNFDIDILTEGGYHFKVLTADCGEELNNVIDAVKVGNYLKFLGDYNLNGVMQFETLNILSNPDSSTYTLNLGATNLNKLTEEEKQIAENKGWTLK